MPNQTDAQTGTQTGTQNGSKPPRHRGAAASRTSPYLRLKQAIMSGEFAPNDPLVEIPLAEWCGVSRTPIREALTRLEQDGLAERTDRGLVVRACSPEEIIDLYESRIVLESKVAAVAAERHTPFDLIGIRRAQQRYRSLAPGDGEELGLRNREFHRSIWLASHSRSLLDLLERLDLHLGRYPLTTLTFPGRHQAAVEEHEELCTAIGARDAGLAAEIATRHFVAARDTRLKLFEQE